MAANDPSATGAKALPLLDVDVLRSFVAIADNASFSRAARQVFRTPSALSMQIKGLEEQLGQTLFVREPRQVRLTAHGELLLGYGRRLLALNAEAVACFVAPDITGRVRLGLPDDLGGTMLSRALGALAHRHPALEVDVVTGASAQLLAAADRGEIDVALVTAGNDGMAAERGTIVHGEAMAWVGLSGGTGRRRRPLPLAVADHGCVWRRVALDALDGAGIEYRVAYSSANGAGQLAAVRADLAVAALPARLVEPPCVIVDDDLPPMADTHVALIRAPERGAAGEALADALESVYRSLRPARAAAAGRSA